MANNIVQHRRGTLAEWLNLDLIPYEGEIIIVELENGTSACKIGDGTSTFSKLPYLTDELKKDLVNRINKLQVNIEQQHQAFVNNYNIELSTLDTSLKTSLANEIELLETKLLDSKSETLQQANEYSDKSILLINNEIIKILEDLSALKAELDGIQTHVDVSVSESFAQIDASLAKAFSEYELGFSEKLNSLKKDFNTELALSNSTNKVNIQKLTDKISNLELYLEQTVRPEITIVDQRLDTKIESVKNYLISNLSSVEAKNEQFNNSLKETLILDLQELKQQVVNLELHTNQEQFNTAKNLDELNKQIVNLVDDCCLT